MTFGTTTAKPWIEALPTPRHPFAGRTFSRFHIVGDGRSTPSVGEIWAASDHVVEAHAHDVDELLYVLSGAIEINGRRLAANDTVFIPRGTAYSARVVGDTGSHVLRVELPGGEAERTPEYTAREWRGPLTTDGFPDLNHE